MSEKNTLYLVSTPIGNLEDITLRGLRILKEVSLILAEDTRRSRKLLEHFSIKTELQSYHDFNKEKVSGRYIRHLQEKGSIALVSDAGTPGVSDPGFFLVREAARAGVRVEAIPGASAVLTALVASGWPTDKFAFEGFPEKKSARRRRQLEAIAERPYTHCFYVSPYHVEPFLKDIVEVFGDKYPLCIARELTKIHEEFLRDTSGAILKHFSERKPKGEFVFLIHGLEKNGITSEAAEKE
jgi:16S rRNA (cytidine1402-2'-O)-methyltransferase